MTISDLNLAMQKAELGSIAEKVSFIDHTSVNSCILCYLFT